MARLMDAVKGVPPAGTDSRRRPCPFCGSPKIDALQAPLGGKMDGTQYWLYCRQCSTSGPIANSQDSAVAFWDRRAQESIVKEVS